MGANAPPECDFVEWNKPVAQTCPNCGNGYMVEAGRKGQLRCPKCQPTRAAAGEIYVTEPSGLGYNSQPDSFSDGRVRLDPPLFPQ